MANTIEEEIQEQISANNISNITQLLQQDPSLLYPVLKIGVVVGSVEFFTNLLVFQHTLPDHQAIYLQKQCLLLQRYDILPALLQIIVNTKYLDALLTDLCEKKQHSLAIRLIQQYANAVSEYVLSKCFQIILSNQDIQSIQWFVTHTQVLQHLPSQQLSANSRDLLRLLCETNDIHILSQILKLPIAQKDHARWFFRFCVSTQEATTFLLQNLRLSDETTKAFVTQFKQNHERWGVDWPSHLLPFLRPSPALFLLTLELGPIKDILVLLESHKVVSPTTAVKTWKVIFTRESDFQLLLLYKFQSFSAYNAVLQKPPQPLINNAISARREVCQFLLHFSAWQKLAPLWLSPQNTNYQSFDIIMATSVAQNWVKETRPAHLLSTISRAYNITLFHKSLLLLDACGLRQQKGLDKILLQSLQQKQWGFAGYLLGTMQIYDLPLEDCQTILDYLYEHINDDNITRLFPTIFSHKSFQNNLVQWSLLNGVALFAVTKQYLPDKTIEKIIATTAFVKNDLHALMEWTQAASPINMETACIYVSATGVEMANYAHNKDIAYEKWSLFQAFLVPTPPQLSRYFDLWISYLENGVTPSTVFPIFVQLETLSENKQLPYRAIYLAWKALTPCLYQFPEVLFSCLSFSTLRKRLAGLSTKKKTALFKKLSTLPIVKNMRIAYLSADKLSKLPLLPKEIWAYIFKIQLVQEKIPHLTTFSTMEKLPFIDAQEFCQDLSSPTNGPTTDKYMNLSTNCFNTG